MVSKYQILEWDSDFFGFAVAKILPKKMYYDQLQNVLIHLKTQNVKLVYWAVDSANKGSHRVAKLLSGHIVDKKITYTIDLKKKHGKKISPTIKVEEYNQLIPNSELEELAIQSGIYSRYNFDPNISKSQFEKLYLSWIFNSTNKTISDAVLVIRKKNKIVGMVTLAKIDENGHIGLIAVDSSMRGRGLGKALVNAAISWFEIEGCNNLKVVTQMRNIVACNLYEKMGFNVKNIEYFYHFWL